MEVVDYLNKLDIWPVALVLMSWLIAIDVGFAYKVYRWDKISCNTRHDSPEGKAARIKRSLYLRQSWNVSIMGILMLCLPYLKRLLAIIIKIHIQVYNIIFN